MTTIERVFLPNPPPLYDVRDQSEMRRALEQALLRVSALSGGSLVFNVKDNGAVGDGTQDDTTGFARAMQKAEDAGGGIVFIPTGTYVVSAEITLASNVTVRGEGAGSLVVPTAMDNLIVFYGSAVSDVTLEDFAIAGTFAVGAGFFDSSFLTVQRLDISGATTAITGPMATGYGTGILIARCDDVEIAGNYLHGNGVRTDNGRLMSDIQTNGAGYLGYSRISIHDNRCTSTDVHYNIQGYNLKDSSIYNNIISGAYTRTADNSGYGIMAYLTYPGEWSAVTTYVIGDYAHVAGVVYFSILGSLNQTPPNATYWTLVDTPLRDVSITGNVIFDCEGPGIYVQSGHRTTVSNNQIRNTGTVMTEVSLLSGAIAFNGGSNLICQGNQLYDFARTGITLVSVEKAVVSQNTITGTLAGGKSTYGIWLRGPSEAVRVEGNDLATCSGGVITVNAESIQTSVVVTGNNVASMSGPGISIITAVGCVVSKNTVTLSGQNGITIGSGAGGMNNVVTDNNVTNSGQSAASTYTNIYVQSPQTTVTGNVTGNTLSDGAIYGVILDPAAAAGSIVAANIGKDNRTADFNLPEDCAAGGNVDTAGAGEFSLGSMAVLSIQGTEGAQLVLGISSSAGAVGTTGSGGYTFVASNARMVGGTSGLTWHQNAASVKSLLMLQDATTGDTEFYVAAAGVSDANIATFWGSPVHTITTAGKVKINGTQVLDAQGAANADTSGATLAQLETEVNELKAMARTHGLIAT